MKTTLLLSVSLITLIACDVENADTAAGQLSMAEYEALTEEQAYELACASCHAMGVNGAPIPGVRADWEERSSLWEAVLLEHANEGYFAMPAKRGA